MTGDLFASNLQNESHVTATFVLSTVVSQSPFVVGQDLHFTGVEPASHIDVVVLATSVVSLEPNLHTLSFLHMKIAASAVPGLA